MMTRTECVRSARPLGPLVGSVFAALAVVVLAACVSAPRAPGLTPLEQALAASARRGNPMAQFSLGTRMFRQARTPRRRAAGVAWIRRSAQANLAVAQDRLGLMYLSGRGVPRDTKRALKWLRRAAERDAPAAQLWLARLYALGRFLPVDNAEACYWYSIAAKPVRSDVTILNIERVRAFARHKARALAASLTPAQRASVERRVASWTPTSSVPYSGVVLLGRFPR